MNVAEKLKQFCIDYPLTESDKRFAAPYSVDGFTIATDNHCIARIKGNFAENKPDYPNAEKFFDDNARSDMRFENGAFQQFLRKYQKEGMKYPDCTECYGSGEVTWEYDGYEKEDECPVCDGTGEDTTKKGTKVLKFIDAEYLEVQPERIVRLKYIEKIVELSGSIEIFKEHSTVEQAFRIDAGEFSCLIMGVQMEERAFYKSICDKSIITYSELKEASLTPELAK